uniref:RNA-dependent RNA polymerase n=1 Tax=Crocidura shantungensis ribovirus 2 TaxID=3139537 RepID=A0AB38ZK28_9VIRU
MRLRDARRHSRYLFRRSLTEYDSWAEIKHLNPKFKYLGGLYRCTISAGRARLTRYHACAYKLIKIVGDIVVGNCFGRNQGQPVVFRAMTNPLSAAVQDLVQEREVPTVGLYGYRFFRPQPLPALKPDHPDVAASIEGDLATPHYLPPDLVERVDEYEHSSLVTDMGRMAPSMAVLTEKPSKPLDLDVLWDMFVTDSLETPYGQDSIVIVPPEFTAVEMSCQTQTTSACGLMALSSQHGHDAGTKKDMHDSAIAINLQDKLGDHVPPANPFKPSLKAEVIKRNKKVRTIMLESQPNFMVLKHYFSSLASCWADPYSNIAIGLSSRDGDFKSIVYQWWMESDMGHDEFLQWLKTAPAHESDKKSWESSTNVTDGVAFLLHLLVRVDIHEKDARLVDRALADYFNPHIQYDAQRAYVAPWRVPSGSYLTSYGNSWRHRAMAKWVINFIGRHGTAGSDSCGCGVCTIGSRAGLEDWARPVSDQEIRMLSRFRVLGDDFIAINPVAHSFDWIMDHVFGTTTVTEVKQFYSEPGLDAPQGAEFLRRHFYLDDSVTPHRLWTFRDAARVLAKLYKGGHRATRERFLAAVDSALNDAGHNEQLFRILLNLRYVMVGNGVIDLDRYRDALALYIRKNPMLEFMSLGYIPTFADIANLDASMLSPLLEVKRSRATEPHGMTPRMYLA